MEVDLYKITKTCNFRLGLLFGKNNDLKLKTDLEKTKISDYGCHEAKCEDTMI